MRFAHLVPTDSAGSESPDPLLAVLRDGEALFVHDLLPDGPRRLQELIAGGVRLLDDVRAAADVAGSGVPLSDFGYASAVLAPPVILAVGLNYSAHSGELGLKADKTPTVFVLWPNSLTGHEGTTTWPRTLSESIDWEAELGVIIGPAAKDVSPENALDHVWGYTVVNDITARDIQYSEAQWSRCKSFDGFTPTGPVVVTADEIPDPQALHLWTDVDGQRMQDATTAQMIRSVATLVSYLSRSATLLPGTLISTGSPGGAGFSRDPQIFLRDRSTVTVGIDGIGELTTHCRMID
jgi:2-keto-4-pentenoate hydratase/2-oxohepta-3-ene-1,7-dioic acid hydratase in catechol pathway